MNVHESFDQSTSSGKKQQLLDAMELDLGRRWWKVTRWFGG